MKQDLLRRRGGRQAQAPLPETQEQFAELNRRTVDALTKSADTLKRLGAEAQLSPVSNDWRLRAATAWVRLLTTHEQLLGAIDGMATAALAKARAEAGLLDEQQAALVATATNMASAVAESVRRSQGGD